MNIYRTPLNRNNRSKRAYYAIAAAIFLGMAIEDGVEAIDANNKAKESITYAIEAEGTSQAAEWQASADAAEHTRNVRLLFAGSLLGVAALNAAAAAGFTMRFKQPEGEDIPDTSSQPQF